MPIVGVPPEEIDSTEYERMLPGCRVEYRGAFWKIIGMYFAPTPTGSESDGGAAPKPLKRTKFLVLRALTLSPDELPLLASSKSS